MSWSSKGGLEGRFEAYGDAGRIVQDISSTALRAFIERPAGYLGEKADADTGWVYPVPDETHVHGHDAMMADIVEAFRAGRAPRETFHDGLVVNRILDAAYRSIRSGRWEPVVADVRAGGPRHDDGRLDDAGRSLPWLTAATERLGAPRRDPGRGHRDGQPVVRRGDRRRRPRPSASGPATRGSRSRRCSRATAPIRASTRSSSCR